MPFSYAAGGTTPIGPPGMVEFPSVRLNDGTFRPLSIPPLMQSPPLRWTPHPAPFDDGGLVTDPLFDIWQFDVTGWLLVDDTSEIQDAVDYLMANVNRDAGWMTVSFYGYGWSAAKTMSCRLAGQVIVVELDKGDMNSVERGFTVPLVAVDPVLA